MSRLHDEWKVDAHGPLEHLGDGVWTVAGEISMPLGHFPRRMTVVVLEGARLLVWSAIPMRDAAMAQLEALGDVAFLVVPGVAHRLDLRAWKRRYPGARVVCAPGAQEAVSQAVPVDATTNVFDDPTVDFQAVPGMEDKEAALWVRRAGGTTLVVNDIIANVQHPNGLGAEVMARLLGFGVKEPQMPWLGEKLFVKDPSDTAAALRAWAQEPQLTRIVVSHGDVIAAAPRETLTRIAADVAD